MSIEFVCSGCSNTLRVPDEHAGKHARCPQCSSVNSIPKNPATPDAPYLATVVENDFFGNVQSNNDPYASDPYAVDPYASDPYANQVTQTDSEHHYPSKTTYDNSGGYQQASDYTPTSYSSGYGPTSHLLPHRGAAILILGFLSIPCNFLLIPSIVACTMGSSDLSEINAGKMDPAGRTLAVIGILLGVLGIIKTICIFLFWLGMLFYSVEVG